MNISPRTYLFPDKNGTIVCTDDLNDYLLNTGGILTGALNMGWNKITWSYAPVNNEDVVNKLYVDNLWGGWYLS